SGPDAAAATTDGRCAWAVTILRRSYRLRTVSAERAAVVQTLTVPAATGVIARDPVRRRAYVAFSDGVRAYAWNRLSGRARPVAYYPLPRPPGHPGDNPRRPAFSGRLALSPDRRTLLVPLALADTTATVDTRARRVTHTDVRSHP